MKLDTARQPATAAALILSVALAVVGVALGTPSAVLADPQAAARTGAAAPSDAAAAPSDELDWARAALARNALLEIVSTDATTGVITVRVKSTGQVREVRADQLIAALPPDEGSSRSARAPATPRGERVIASGPGYSIAAAGPPSGGSAGASSGAAAESAADDTGPARNLPIERRHEPIICQGARLLHIDSANLVFDGNAVSAEQGCELHITNSTIRARGIGVAARGASVHIDNSVIVGGQGSVDASGGAQVYARSSTFKGLIRRNDTAAFHDLGGNVGD